MKYEPIEFSKLSEAIAYVEDGGEICEYDHPSNDYLDLSTAELLFKWHQNLFTKTKQAPWCEKLDGTVNNGVLCWVDDSKIPHRLRTHVSMIVEEGQNCFIDNMDGPWGCATPLTRTEIQKFMDNAPEES